MLPLQADGPSKDGSKELGALLGLIPADIAVAAAAAAAAQPAGPQAPQKAEEGDAGAVQQAGDRVVWLVWAEASGERVSPSLLMGYSLLTSRSDSALFLRMVTGFGFAQACTPPAPANLSLPILQMRVCCSAHVAAHSAI